MDATKKRRRVYLVRHGDVSYFDGAGKPFRPDGVPLNAEGRAQATLLAELLAGVPQDRIVSSTLPRCVETASIIGGGRAVETCATLREIQPGRLADIPADQVSAAFLDAFQHAVRRETRFLGGETIGSLVDRVLAWCQTTLADQSWRHLLVVAHGGVNRVILGHSLGSGLAAFGAIEQDAGCLNIIDVDSDGRALVRLLNHTPYNAAKTGMDLTTMERILAQYRRDDAPKSEIRNSKSETSPKHETQKGSSDG